MTHILIPREPSAALLRPFIGCNTQELHEAWAAMVRIAEVQHARDGRSCLAQIEEPAAPAAVTGPASAAKFTDESTADPVEKARRYLKAMADETPNSVYFFGDGYPRRASSLDAKATLAVLEQLAALEAPAAPAEFDAWWERAGDGRSKLMAKQAWHAALAAAPQTPAGVIGWVHPQWATEQGRGRIYGHNPGGYVAVQIAAPQAPAAPSAVATQVVESLLQLARIVNTAVEDWGESFEDGSSEVTFHKEEADKLEEILEFFDSLPDAPPEEGVILSGPSRAARVLRAMAAPAAPAVDASSDTARLDHLQQREATVDLLPGEGDFYPMRFRVGGLHAAVSTDIRAAIDAAIAAQAAAKGSA